MKGHIMIRSLLTLIVATLAFAASASAAPPEPSGTIAISPSTPGPYALGGLIAFNTTSTGLKGGQYPMVYVACRFDSDDSVAYGELDYPDTVFTLGGGSSRWTELGGNVHCAATLYAYGGKQKGRELIVQLADPVEFTATG